MALPCVMCVCTSFQLLDQLTDFYEASYESYAVVNHPTIAFSDYLQAVITK